MFLLNHRLIALMVVDENHVVVQVVWRNIQKYRTYCLTPKLDQSLIKVIFKYFRNGIYYTSINFPWKHRFHNCFPLCWIRLIPWVLCVHLLNINFSFHCALGFISAYKYDLSSCHIPKSKIIGILKGNLLSVLIKINIDFILHYTIFFLSWSTTFLSRTGILSDYWLNLYRNRFLRWTVSLQIMKTLHKEINMCLVYWIVLEFCICFKILYHHVKKLSYFITEYLCKVLFQQVIYYSTFGLYLFQRICNWGYVKCNSFYCLDFRTLRYCSKRILSEYFGLFIEFIAIILYLYTIWYLFMGIF